MATQSIDIPSNTPIAAAGALKQAGYSVTTGGKPVNVSETENMDNNDRTLDSLASNEYVTIFQWVINHGGKELFNKKNIGNSHFLVKGLINGTITIEDIDNITDEPLSDKALYRKTLPHIEKLKQSQLQEGKETIHTEKWSRCVDDVKQTGKSEKSAHKICSSKIKNAGVKASHQQKSGKQYVANRNKLETNEGQTMLDVFPELNQSKPSKGGEVKNIKTQEKPMEKVNKPKEVLPKKVKRDPKMENVMTKKQVMEAILSGGAAPAPSRPAPDAPTTTPTKPSQRPERQNPFRPKPGVNPNPKAKLPNWLSSEKLGIGGNDTEVDDIMEIRKLIKRTI
jgi:hypothetical protein